jgi:hypothetical protein
MRIEGLHAVPQIPVPNSSGVYTRYNLTRVSVTVTPYPASGRLSCASLNNLQKLHEVCEEIHARSRKLTSDEESGLAR